MSVDSLIDAQWVIQEVILRLEADEPASRRAPSSAPLPPQAQTLFPRVKGYLDTNEVYQDILTDFIDPEDLRQYASIIDYLFCEFVASGLKREGQHFHLRKQTMRLDALLKPHEAEILDQMLIVVVEIIVAAHQNDIKITKQDVRDLFQLAIQST